MAKMLSAKLDVTKITKSKLYAGAKGTYCNITISLNDEIDQFGNNVSVYEEQTKEERDQKADRNYLGNGKVFWSNDGKAQQAPAQGGFGGAPAQDAPKMFNAAGDEVDANGNVIETLPF